MADMQMPDSRRLKLAEQGHDPADEPDETTEQDEPKKKPAKKK